MVYNISYNSLDTELKKAIRAKSFSSDELKKIYTQIKQENDKKKKTLNKVMIFIIIIFFLMTILTLSKKTDTGHAIISLLFTIPAIAIVYAVLYFTQIGIMKMQFNNAIKKSYPELANEIKL